MNRDLMTGFADYLRSRDASPATVDAYLRDLNKFARWYLGTYGSEPEPASVGPLDIAEFKRHLMNRGQKPATINRALASLSAFFRWAKDEGLASGHPTEGVKKLKEVRLSPRSLGRKEQMALMRAAQAAGRARDVAVMTLLLHTGLRVSEVCGLNLEDVHLGERSGEVVVAFT
ncbi:MAG: phage integrase N-terminal SAM-like domain-containing protein [Clostridia bacterium]|nr:phage integrase N-terminal SAM-like domain-containing protein [Clostridia bacterium]